MTGVAESMRDDGGDPDSGGGTDARDLAIDQ